MACKREALILKTGIVNIRVVETQDSNVIIFAMIGVLKNIFQRYLGQMWTLPDMYLI